MKQAIAKKLLPMSFVLALVLAFLVPMSAYAADKITAAVYHGSSKASNVEVQSDVPFVDQNLSGSGWLFDYADIASTATNSTKTLRITKATLVDGMVVVTPEVTVPGVTLSYDPKDPANEGKIRLHFISEDSLAKIRYNTAEGNGIKVVGDETVPMSNGKGSTNVLVSCDRSSKPNLTIDSATAANGTVTIKENRTTVDHAALFYQVDLTKSLTLNAQCVSREGKVTVTPEASYDYPRNRLIPNYNGTLNSKLPAKSDEITEWKIDGWDSDFAKYHGKTKQPDVLTYVSGQGKPAEESTFTTASKAQTFADGSTVEIYISSDKFQTKPLTPPGGLELAGINSYRELADIWINDTYAISAPLPTAKEKNSWNTDRADSRGVNATDVAGFLAWAKGFKTKATNEKWKVTVAPTLGDLAGSTITVEVVDARPYVDENYLGSKADIAVGKKDAAAKPAKENVYWNNMRFQYKVTITNLKSDITVKPTFYDTAEPFVVNNHTNGADLKIAYCEPDVSKYKDKWMKSYQTGDGLHTWSCQTNGRNVSGDKAAAGYYMHEVPFRGSVKATTFPFNWGGDYHVDKKLFWSLGSHYDYEASAHNGYKNLVYRDYTAGSQTDYTKACTASDAASCSDYMSLRAFFENKDTSANGDNPASERIATLLGAYSSVGVSAEVHNIPTWFDFNGGTVSSIDAYITEEQSKATDKQKNVANNPNIVVPNLIPTKGNDAFGYWRLEYKDENNNWHKAGNGTEDKSQIFPGEKINIGDESLFGRLTTGSGKVKVTAIRLTAIYGEESPKGPGMYKADKRLCESKCTTGSGGAIVEQSLLATFPAVDGLDVSLDADQYLPDYIDKDGKRFVLVYDENATNKQQLLQKKLQSERIVFDFVYQKGYTVTFKPGSNVTVNEADTNGNKQIYVPEGSVFHQSQTVATTAAKNYVFKGWKKEGDNSGTIYSTEQIYRTPVNADVSYVAVAVEDRSETPTVTVTNTATDANTSGSGTTVVSGTAVPGSQVTITYTDKSGQQQRKTVTADSSTGAYTADLGANLPKDAQVSVTAKQDNHQLPSLPATGTVTPDTSKMDTAITEGEALLPPAGTKLQAPEQALKDAIDAAKALKANGAKPTQAEIDAATAKIKAEAAKVTAWLDEVDAEKSVLSILKDSQPTTSVSAGTEVTVKVDMKDHRGNKYAGTQAPNELKVNLPGLGEVTLTKQNDGSYSIAATPTKAVASTDATVTSTGYTKVPAVKFAVTSASAADKLVGPDGQPTNDNASTVTLSPSPATAGEAVTATVVLKDKYGNPVDSATNPTTTVGGKEVALTPVAGKPGEYTFTYTPEKHTEKNAPLDVAVKVGSDTVATGSLNVNQQIPDSVEFTNAPNAGVVGTAVAEGSDPGQSGSFIAKKNGKPVPAGTEVYVKVPGKTDPVKVVTGAGGVAQIPGFTPDTKGTQKIEVFPVDANGDRQTAAIGSTNVEVERATSSDPVITSVGSYAKDPDQPNNSLNYHGTLVTGTGTPGATITVTVPTADGSSKTVTGTVEGDGNFSIEIDEDVAEGAQVSVTQEDKSADKKPSAAVTAPVTVDRTRLSAAQQEAGTITLPDPAKTPEEKALKAAIDAAQAISENGTKKPTQKNVDDATAALKEAIKNYQNSYDPATSTVALTGKNGSPISEVVAGEEITVTVNLKNHAGTALTPGPSSINVTVPGVTDPVELSCTGGVCTAKVTPKTAGSGNVVVTSPDYKATTLEKPLTVKPAGAADAKVSDDTPKTGIAGEEIQGGKVKVTDEFGNPVATGTTVYAKLPGKDTLVPVVIGQDGSADIPAFTPPAAGTNTVKFFASNDESKSAIGSYDVNVDKATSAAPSNVKVTNTAVDPANAQAPHGTVITGDAAAPNGTKVIVSYPDPNNPSGKPIVKEFPNGVVDGKINVNLGDEIPGGTKLTVTLQEPDKYPSDHGKTDGSGSAVVTVATDKSALDAAISNAGPAIATPNPLHPEEQALNDAITEANRVKNDPQATQAQIDAATKALNDAKTAYDKVYSPKLSTLKVVDPQSGADKTTVVAGNPIKIVFTPKNNKGETPENLPATMQVRVPGVKDLVTLTLDSKTGTYVNGNVVPETVASGDSAKLAVEDTKFPAEAGDGNNPALEVTPAAPAHVEFVNLPSGAISEQAVSGVEIRVTDEFGNRAPAGSKVFVKVPGEENPREVQVGANGIATISDFTPVVTAKGNVDIIAYPVGSDGLADTKKEIGKDSFLVDMATTPAPTDLVLTNTARDPEHPDTTPGGTVLTGHSDAKPGSTVTVEFPNPADPSGAPITKTGVVGDDGNFTVNLGNDLPKGTTPKVTVSQDGKYPSKAVDEDNTGTKLSVSPDTTQADKALANANDVPANPQTDIERAYQKAKQDLENGKANPTISQKALDDLTDALNAAKKAYDNVYNPANSSVTLSDQNGQPLTKVTAGEPVKIAVDLKNNANSAFTPKPQTITVAVPGVKGDVTLTLDPDTGLYQGTAIPQSAVPAADNAKVTVTTPDYAGPSASLTVDPASGANAAITIPEPTGGFVSEKPVTGGTVKVTDQFGNPVKEGDKVWVALPGNDAPVEVTVGKDGVANLPEFTPIAKEHKDLPITVYAPKADGTGADTAQKLGESTINVDMAVTPAPDQITLTATARDPEDPTTTPGGVVLQGHSSAAPGSEVSVSVLTPDGQTVIKTGTVGKDGNFTVDLGADLPKDSKPTVVVTEPGKYPSTGTATDANNAALVVPVDEAQAQKALQDNPGVSENNTPAEKAYNAAVKKLQDKLADPKRTQAEIDDLVDALRQARDDYDKSYSPDSTTIKITDAEGKTISDIIAGNPVKIEVDARDHLGNVIPASKLPESIQVNVPGFDQPVTLTLDKTTGKYLGDYTPTKAVKPTDPNAKITIKTPEFAGPEQPLNVKASSPAEVSFAGVPSEGTADQAIPAGKLEDDGSVTGGHMVVKDQYGNLAEPGAKVYVNLPGETAPVEVTVGENGIALLPGFTPLNKDQKKPLPISVYPELGADGHTTGKELGKTEITVDLATTPAPTEITMEATARDPKDPVAKPGNVVLKGKSTAQPGSTVTVTIPNPADPSQPRTVQGTVKDDGSFSIDLGDEIPVGTQPSVTVTEPGKHTSAAVNQADDGSNLASPVNHTDAQTALGEATNLPADPQTKEEKAYADAYKNLEDKLKDPQRTQKEIDDATAALRAAKDGYDNVYNPDNSAISLSDAKGAPIGDIVAGNPVSVRVTLKNNVDEAFQNGPDTIVVKVPGVAEPVTLQKDPANPGQYIGTATPTKTVPATADEAERNVSIQSPAYTGPKAPLSVAPAIPASVQFDIPEPAGGFVANHTVTGGTGVVRDQFGNLVAPGEKVYVKLPSVDKPVELVVGENGKIEIPDFTPRTTEKKDMTITPYLAVDDEGNPKGSPLAGGKAINVDKDTTDAPQNLKLTATARDPENPDLVPGGVVLTGNANPNTPVGSKVHVTIPAHDGKAERVVEGVVAADGTFTINLGAELPKGLVPSVAIEEDGKYTSAPVSLDQAGNPLATPVDTSSADKTLQANPQLSDTAQPEATAGEKAYEQARQNLLQALKQENVTQKEIDDLVDALRTAKADLETERTFNADNSEILLSYGDSDKEGESTENVKKEHLVNIEVKLRDNAGNILHESPESITVKVPGVADPVVLTKDPATGTFKGVAKPMTPTTGTNDDNKLVITTPEYAGVSAGTLNVNEWDQASAPENVKVTLSRDSVEAGSGETESQRHYVVSGTGAPGAKVTLRDANGQALLDADGKEITAIVGADGHFELPIPAGLDEGTTFKVSQLQDETLESSSVETGNVLDTVPPTKVEISGGVKDSGEILLTPVGEGKFVAGDIVTVTLPDGSKLTHTITDEDVQAGHIKVLLPQPLSPGETINISIGDGINTSASDTYTVPERTPDPTNVHIVRDPVGQGKDGERLSYLVGEGVPGATVTLVDANGNVVVDQDGRPVTAVVGKDGTFKLPLPSDIKDGESFGVFQDVAGQSTSLTVASNNYVDLSDPAELEAKQPSANDRYLQIKVPTDDTVKIHVVFPDGSEIIVDKLLDANGKAYWAVNGEKINIVDGYLQLPVRFPASGTIKIYAEDAMGNQSQLTSVEIIPVPKADLLALTGSNGLELVLISLVLVGSGSVILLLVARRTREQENC